MITELREALKAAAAESGKKYASKKREVTKPKKKAAMQGRRPKSKNVRLPSCDIGKAPEWMSEYARDEWERVVVVLRDMGANLSGLDTAAMVNYCTAMGLIKACTLEIEEEGQTIMNPQGMMVRHPASTTLNQAMSQARQWAVELGLTPASKGKIPMAKPNERQEKFKAI